MKADTIILSIHRRLGNGVSAALGKRYDDWMNFSSDNVGDIAPEILEALIATNVGTAPAYGDDAVTPRLENRWHDRCARPVTAFDTSGWVVDEFIADTAKILASPLDCS